MSLKDMKFDLGQVIQLVGLLGAGAAAWFNLSSDMALIKHKLEVSGEFVVKTERRLSEIEERIQDVETTNRALWSELRGSRGSR